MVANYTQKSILAHEAMTAGDLEGARAFYREAATLARTEAESVLIPHLRSMYLDDARNFERLASHESKERPLNFKPGNKDILSESGALKIHRNPSTTFDKIIGHNKLKRDLLGIVSTQDSDYSAWRDASPLPGRVATLVHGPFGTGKTFLAMATAAEIAKRTKEDCPLLEVNAAELFQSYFAQSAQKAGEVSDAIDYYSTKGPAVILIDEAEDLLTDRDKMGNQATDNERRGVVNVFLKRIQANMKNSQSQALYVLATNHPHKLDKAAVRAGRIGGRFYAGLPQSTDEIEQLLKLYLNSEDPKTSKLLGLRPEDYAIMSNLLDVYRSQSEISQIAGGEEGAYKFALQRGQDLRIPVNELKVTLDDLLLASIMTNAQMTDGLVNEHMMFKRGKDVIPNEEQYGKIALGQGYEGLKAIGADVYGIDKAKDEKLREAKRLFLTSENGNGNLSEAESERRAQILEEDGHSLDYTTPNYIPPRGYGKNPAEPSKLITLK